MGDERRAYDRQPLRSQQISGSFVLTCQGHGIAFESVENISVSGLGIVIPMCLENGTEVEISYQGETGRISTRGHVAWAVHAEQGYRIGIHFDPVYMNDNVNFFMNMREFVDDANGAF